MKMRDIINILNEAIMMVDGVKVFKNPPFVQLINMVPLRGTVDGNKLYLWYAEDGYHNDMNGKLGLPEYETGIYITKENEEPDASEWGYSPWIEGKGIRLYWQQDMNIDSTLSMQKLIEKITDKNYKEVIKDIDALITQHRDHIE